MVLPTAAAVRQGWCVVLSACCLMSVICGLAKKMETLLVKKLPYGRKCKDGLVSKLLLQRSVCFSINGHAHPAAAQQKRVL